MDHRKKTWVVLFTMTVCVFILHEYLDAQSWRSLRPLGYYGDVAFKEYNHTHVDYHKLVRENLTQLNVRMDKSVVNGTKYSTALIVLFTTWKTHPEKYLLHNLTITNWKNLGPSVRPVVFTNDSNIAKACTDNEWNVKKVRNASKDGIPLLKDMFLTVKKAYDSPFYAFSNSDILFTKTLIETMEYLLNKYKPTIPLLVVGRRMNINFVTEEEGHSFDNITKAVRKRGGLQPPYSADYFITSASFPWHTIAPVIVGRDGYDNYLMYMARKANITVIDATKTILAVHQTTSAGNREGKRSKDSWYNVKILKQIYKNLRFKKETTECITNFTAYTKDGIEMRYRKPSC